MFTERALDYYKKGYIWLCVQLVLLLIFGIVFFYTNPSSLKLIPFEGVVAIFAGFWNGYWTRKAVFPAPPEELLSSFDTFWNFGMIVIVFVLCLVLKNYLASYLGIPQFAFGLFLSIIMSLYILGRIAYLIYERVRRFRNELSGEYVEPTKSLSEADQDFHFQE